MYESDLPERIEQHAINVARLEDEILRLRLQTKAIEQQTALDIAVMKDKDTGKLMFTNDTAREAACHARLEMDTDYQTLAEKHRNALLERAHTQAAHERAVLEGKLLLLRLEHDNQMLGVFTVRDMLRDLSARPRRKNVAHVSPANPANDSGQERLVEQAIPDPNDDRFNAPF